MHEGPSKSKKVIEMEEAVMGADHMFKDIPDEDAHEVEKEKSRAEIEKETDYERYSDEGGEVEESITQIDGTPKENRDKLREVVEKFQGQGKDYNEVLGKRLDGTPEDVEDVVNQFKGKGIDYNKTVEKRLDGTSDNIEDVVEKFQNQGKDYNKTLEKRLDGTPEDVEDVVNQFKKEGKEYNKTLEEHLDERSKELDTELEKVSGLEKGFRWMGEKYNKLGWKSKLAVGLSLGVGAAAFSTVSMPIAFACLSGIAAQRVAGMASMFLKFEKKDQPGQRKKEMAMLMAAGYSVGMGLAISEAVHLASESSWGEAVHGWLKDHWPFGGSVAAAPVHEHVAPPAHAPNFIEPPPVSAEASAGHGYEFMVKRLWEQLHDPANHYSLPANADPNSDIAKLFAADANSIDKVVHQIAADPQHGFFNADGTSIQIDPTDHLSFGTDGQIHLAGEASHSGFAVHAPEGSPVTPAYHPEAPSVSDAGANVPAEAAPAPTAEIPTQAEVPAQPVEAPATPEPPAHGAVPVPVENAPVEHAVPSVEAPAVHESITNSFGVPVNPEVPAIYQVHATTGETYFTVYGGSDEDRFKMIQNFLMRPENQEKSIRFAHKVSSLFGSRIQVDEIGAHTVAGHTSWIANFFSKQPELPDPKNFNKLITK